MAIASKHQRKDLHNVSQVKEELIPGNGSKSYKLQRLKKTPCDKLELRNATIEPSKTCKIAPLRRKVMPKAEQEAYEAKMAARENLVQMNRQDTQKFRYSNFHLLCLSTLEQGYHSTFSEIYWLTKRDRDLQLKQEKLTKLYNHLSAAEISEGKGELSKVYSHQLTLAKYFSDEGDVDIARHFYRLCLRTATSLNNNKEDGSAPASDDGLRLLAQAHCLNGTVQEEIGDLSCAEHHYSIYRNLSTEHEEWSNFEGRSFWRDSCSKLSTIYRKLADKNQENTPVYEDYLMKSYEKAKEAGVHAQMSLATYRMGVNCMKGRRFEAAMKYLRDYANMCEKAQDNAGLGTAYRALASAAESAGKVSESIKFLESYLNAVPDEDDNNEHKAAAAAHLGLLHNNLGDYPAASEQLRKAFVLSGREKRSTRVQLGTAEAHKMLTNMVKHVELADRQCLERLSEWKSTRESSFEKPIDAFVEPPLYFTPEVESFMRPLAVPSLHSTEFVPFETIETELGSIHASSEIEDEQINEYLETGEKNESNEA